MWPSRRSRSVTAPRTGTVWVRWLWNRSTCGWAVVRRWWKPVWPLPKYNPTASGYYGSFGFHSDRGITCAGPPPENFMALLLSGPTARGDVRYHEAFAAKV